ncbi:NAD-dependent epimerase/dehydratase family protein [Desulfofalx alkaliphila]|uniref:NAD-dependent epimerase/dehydratase family protein n=1 Tax=Desulfofalx alkaliphila TaxID=105483 RepID=UPI0004E1C8C7|nr:NAD-dependent epimerase/dehydratase family protein [Desulfofalx alkaliphila]
MRVLVTGGAGFIGSHIVDLLIEQGHSVLIVDNLETGSEANLNAKARFIKLDICHRKLAAVVDKFRPEAVVHQAAQVSVQRSLEDPVHDVRVNIEGMVNLLEACRLAGVRKVVHASSAAVYGEPQYLPVDVRHPLKPMCGYGVSKRCGELYLEAYCMLCGLQYTVLRYANVYGPRQPVTGEGGVVALFLNQMRRGLTPLIFGDGLQTRDFIHVRDVAAANVAALTRGNRQILNVGTGKATSINQLFALLKKITGYRGRPQYAPPRKGDIRHSYLSSWETQVALGWEPVWSIEQGLKNYCL